MFITVFLAEAFPQTTTTYAVCVCVCARAHVSVLSRFSCVPMDHGPPGSSVHGIVPA